MTWSGDAMRTYTLQLTNFDATVAGPIIAINNPANSGHVVTIRCVENNHTDSVTVASYKIERFVGVATGGAAMSLEPGDDSPRIARRDSLDKAPEFTAQHGAVVAPGAATYDESFTVISRQGSSQACRELDEHPLKIRPGECAVLSLIQADISPASVAIELHEEDAVPGIALPTSPFVRLLGESFSGSGAPSSETWDIVLANNGTALMSGGELVLSTSATANGSVTQTGNRRARFLTGAVHEFVAVARLGDTGIAGNYRAFGAFTTDGANGLAFVLSGTSFGVLARKAGVDTIIGQASWDVDNFTVDTDLHEWRIRYDIDRVEFIVDGVLRHSLHSGATPRIDDRDLTIRFENVNSNGLASNRLLSIAAAAIKRHGPMHGAVRYHHFDGTAQAVTVKPGAGTVAQLLITKAGSGGSSIVLYDGTDNTGRVIAHINADALASLSFGTDGAEFSAGLHVETTINSGKSTLLFD